MAFEYIGSLLEEAVQGASSVEIRGKDLEKKEQNDEREKRVQKAVLEIKNRFGANAIMKGTSYQDAATGIERNESIGGHKA